MRRSAGGTQPWVGRAQELAVLDTARSTVVRARRAAVVLITGPAGVGKTALARRLGRAMPSIEVAAAAIADDLESLLDAIGDLVQEAPMLLVVDDLHAATDSDVRALRLLLRQLESLPVLVVITSRPATGAAVSAFVEDLLRSDATLVRLREFDADEVAELAAQTTGGAPSPELLEWLARGGGNALWTSELLRAATDGGPLRDTVTVQELVLQRAASIDGAGVWLPAAVVLEAFMPDDLAEICGTPVVDLLPSLQAAERAGVLESADDQLRIRHDLLREVLYDDLPAALRGVLHRHAATVLEARGAPAGTVIAHLEAATVATASDVQLVVAGAFRWAQVAPARAVPLIDRAISLLAPDDPRRTAIEARATIAYLTVGRGQEGEAMARALIDRDDVAPAAREDAYFGLMLILQSRPDELDALANRVLADPSASIERRCAALHHRAVVELAMGKPCSAAAFATRALSTEANRHREELEGFLSAVVALSMMAKGDVAGALKVCPDEQSGRSIHRRSRTLVALTRGGLLLDLDDIASATAAMATAAAFERDVEPEMAAISRAILAFTHLFGGDLLSAGLEAEAALRTLPAEVDGVIATQLANGVLDRVSLLRGDDAIVAEPALDVWPLYGEVRAWAHALRLERDGDGQTALGVLLDAWRRGEDARYLHTWRSVAPDLVRLAVSQSATAVAEEVTNAARLGASRCDAASAQAAARRCDGLLTGDVALLLEAAVHFDVAGRPLDKAAAIADAARVVRAKDATRGRMLFRDASDLYASMGAAGEAARLAVFMGRGRPPARAALGWDAVTAAEWDVVRLAAAGLTNPQIAAEIGVSRHTVATHLRHVFAKVGVSTRAALAAAVAGRPTGATHTN